MQGPRRAKVNGLADRALRLLHRYGPVSRVVRHVTTLEAFDLGLVLAAQVFLTLVPLLIVLATFAPRLLGVGLSDELQASLGLSNSSLAFRDMLGPPGHASRVGGLLGFVLLVSAGASTATALQRGYERIWSLPRFGVIRSSWRSTAWVAVCVGAFVLTGLADATFANVQGAGGVLLVFSLAGAVLFWWWTPHLLLAGRVGWRDLFPGAILTGGVLVALLRISPLLMPGFVTSSESEFGPLGTVFLVMVWLTIVCSIVVFCAIAGQVIATEPRLARLLHQARPRQAARARQPARPRPTAARARPAQPARGSALDGAGTTSEPTSGGGAANT